ncbi:MAG: EamA family transporter RarD [Alphaproteobacteria bacterium]
MMDQDRSVRIGLACGLSAFFIWGLLPIYLKQLAALSAFDVLAWRILFSTFVVALVLKVSGQWTATVLTLRDLAAHPIKLVRGPLLSAFLISYNWLVFLWAVNEDRILETSVGYYLNPLVIVLLGRVFLKEMLSPLQWLAVGLATLGLSIMLPGLGTWPWIPLSLAISFGIYALIRKVAPMNGLIALLVEGMVLSPLAALWLLASPMSVGIAGTWQTGGVELMALLFGAGIITVTPLALYIGAARRLRFSTVGMLQYLAPTLSFLSGVFLYDEPFTSAHGMMFACIWAGVIIFMTDLIRSSRAKAKASKAITPDTPR